ncbi:DUF6082 family protein [Nonomuraea sp. JJY05]|jgi:hypothetical protein|uniref:DUF6082 family protein n=1 Tax=Nonomuraea sp. JJY05 TaxID=3350255 RepID=UPI00373F988D
MARAVAKWVGGVAAGLAILLMLLASPFALGQLASAAGIDWASLADVGDAYGSAVALLTAVSLLVLAVSVAFQARTARISSETAVRTLHVEMMRFAIEDPSLMQMEGAEWDGTAEGAEEMRRWAYINMQLGLYRSFHALKELPSPELRMAMAARFTSRLGREHWEHNRIWFQASERNRHDRRFNRIVEEEYQKAIQAGEAVAERSRVTRSKPPRGLVVGGAAAVVALGAGVLLGRRRGGRA